MHKMNKQFFLLILSFFLPAFLFGQTNEWYLLQTNSGLCSQSIVLFSNGIYNFESGCEASSHFSFGRWVQKKDTIKFFPTDNRSFKVIKDISTTRSGNKNMSVRIFDCNGANITSRVSVRQYIRNIGSYTMELNNSETERNDYKRDSSILILKSLQRLFNQKLEIPADSFKSYDITLNIPKNWTFSINSDWSGIESFELIKNKNPINLFKT